MPEIAPPRIPKIVKAKSCCHHKVLDISNNVGKANIRIAILAKTIVFNLPIISEILPKNGIAIIAINEV